MKKLFGRIGMVLILTAGPIIGALYLNSAAYHLWLADGPPVKNPNLHLKLFYQHFVIALCCLGISIGIGIAYWVRKKRRASR